MFLLELEGVDDVGLIWKKSYQKSYKKLPKYLKDRGVNVETIQLMSAEKVRAVGSIMCILTR